MPFAELKENTTYDLVNDFEKIRVKLGVEKWQVFGGSCKMRRPYYAVNYRPYQ